MTKQALRAQYKSKRQNLSITQVNDFSMVMASRFMSEFVNPADVVHVYLPIQKNNEPNTLYTVKKLWEQQHVVYASVTLASQMQLRHFELKQDLKFTLDSWGIPVPVETELLFKIVVNIVLVPLLCCDMKGNRVGYGKGYYDRFLAEYPSARKVGFSFFEPVDAIQDVDPFDIPLDALITPYQTFYFDHEK